MVLLTIGSSVRYINNCTVKDIFIINNICFWHLKQMNCNKVLLNAIKNMYNQLVGSLFRDIVVLTKIVNNTYLQTIYVVQHL